MPRLYLLLLMTVLLVACSAAPPAVSSGSDRQPETDLMAQAQTLPISARVILGNATVELEVARSPREQAIGLMHRPSLPDNRGMLFPLPPPSRSAFG